MKKAIYALAALAALTLASCSSEDAVTAPAADGTVTFTATLPAMASRAFADGTTAAKLAYYVYDAEAAGDTKTVLFDGTADFDGLHATVQLALVTGKTYDIVFWADSYGKDAADKPYAYDGATQTVTVSYGTAANDEARDAFYYTRAGLKVTGAVSETVTLRRPFAQLNIGTSDLEAATAAGMKLSKTGLYIADMPTALNLYDGTVSGRAEARFTAATLPTGEAFPVEPTKYGYLSMNYILVGADKTTVDVHLTSDINASADRQDVAFTAVPVQRNHRTNIYGALLTNPAVFDVEINPDFEGSNDTEIWNGLSEEIEAVENVYSISKAAQLAYLSELSATNANALAGKKIVLTNDINLSGNDWTPIKSFSPENIVTLDGQGHTISGINAPLFATLCGNISNLNFVDVNITKTIYFIGTAVGNLYGNLENIHVEGANIQPEGDMFTVKRVGTVVGIYNSGNATNVTVNAATVKGHYCTGGIFGTINETPNRTFTNCSITASTISGGVYNGALVADVNVSGIRFVSCTYENCEPQVAVADYDPSNVTFE